MLDIIKSVILQTLRTFDHKQHRRFRPFMVIKRSETPIELSRNSHW